MLNEFEDMVCRAMCKELDKRLRAEKERDAAVYVSTALSALISNHIPYLPLSKARKTEVITSFSDFIHELANNHLSGNSE